MKGCEVGGGCWYAAANVDSLSSNVELSVVISIVENTSAGSLLDLTCCLVSAPCTIRSSSSAKHPNRTSNPNARYRAMHFNR